MSNRYSEEELAEIGFASLGKNVSIFKPTVFVNPERISIGDNTRIDCFSLITAGDDGVFIGSHCHIAAGCYIFGSSGKIVMGDCSGLAPRVTLFTITDDYKEGWMGGPTIPLEFRKVTTGPIVLKEQAGVGTASIVMPSVTLGFGCRVGAMSFVHRDIEDFEIVAGRPLRKIGEMNRRLVELQNRFLQDQALY